MERSVSEKGSCNMPRKSVYVRHYQSFPFHYGRAAYTLAQGDFRAGGLALKRAQPQHVPVQKVKSRPVDIRQVLIQQRGQIGRVGYGPKARFCQCAGLLQ